MRRFFHSGITLALLVLLPLVAEANTCFLKQSTALATGIRLGPFLDSTDGATTKTGLTIAQADVRISKGEGAFAQKNDATSCTHLENGWYKCPIDATDTGTAGIIVFAVTKATALPVWKECMVQPATVYDAMFTNAVGAAGGFFGVGTNASLTITGATTLTGNVVLSDGLTISAPSTTNRAGLTISGNGTGAAISATGGATGSGVAIAGGGTGGAGISVTTTSGNGFDISPTAGHGLNIAANGTSKHGLFITGGTAGTSDGIKAVAGSGGKDFRAATGITVDACTGCSAALGTTIMPEAAYVKGSTSVIHEIFIKDSSTGAGKTGLTDASSGLTIAFGRADQGNAAYTTCAAASATRGSYTSCGFKEKDATNAPGWYELGLTTAMLATGADYVTVSVYGVSGTTPTQLPIALVDVGLAAINTKLGTPAGASVSADVATLQTSATAIKAKTDSLNYSGSNVLTEVAAYSSGKAPLQPTTTGRTLTVSANGNASINWGDVENPTTTVGLTGTTHSTSQVIASVSGSVGSVTGAVGSVTGSVASVTGAVGSVTGNVGGNVVGSVGSVTGNVGGSSAAVITGAAIRKNVASQHFPIYLVLTSDHISAATSKTVTVQVSKDGGSFNNITGSVTEIANGWYDVALSQADTNCTSCAYRATAASTDTRNWYILTSP